MLLVGVAVFVRGRRLGSVDAFFTIALLQTVPVFQAVVQISPSFPLFDGTSATSEVQAYAEKQITQWFHL